VVAAVRSRPAAMTAVALLLVLLFAQTSQTFLTTGNLIDAFSGFAFVAIAAVGMTYLFIAGEFDLSIGATFGFAGIMTAWLTVNGMHGWYALVVTLGLGLLIGAVNAFFVTIVRIPSFIVTIGMLSVLQGATLSVSGGFPVRVPEEQISAFMSSLVAGSVGSIPARVWWALGILLVAGLVLRFTRFGYHVYLTGGNPRAARQLGISVVRVKTACFMLSGLLGAACGALQVLWLGSAQPTTGFGNFLFQVAAAAILGGVALTGGEGSIYGTFMGVVILALLSNGLALSGVNPGMIFLLTGALIVGAATINALARAPAGEWRKAIRRNVALLKERFKP
jgi:ribose/xylose/arabinose/galactoside ABC-type transport system permease subunit